MLPIIACTHLWEVSLAVADKQTSLATAAVADHDDLLRVGWPLGHGSARGFPTGRSAHHCADRAVT